MAELQLVIIFVLHFPGCDGCLNWDGVGARYPAAAEIRNKFLYEDIKNTNNNGLEYTVAVLEEIYTNPAFPPKAPGLSQSLRDSGKSRLEVYPNVVFHTLLFLTFEKVKHYL